MIKSRLYYWNCSSFADFIRGTKKPLGLEWKEWDKWHESARKKHPYRYWIAEEGLNKLQDLFMFPVDVYYSVKVYIRNRFIDKIHYLKTGLKPGKYYDLDHRILHGLFNELVIFVEMDLAHLTRWDQSKDYRFKNGRSIDAAYDYLEWACNIKYDENYMCYPGDPDYGTLTDQAKNMIKVKELYEWWTKERPNRVNPHNVINRKTHGKYYYRLIDEMEREYEQIDTDKLIELIKITGSLWT
jgi:hypothetical protein